MVTVPMKMEVGRWSDMPDGMPRLVGNGLAVDVFVLEDGFNVQQYNVNEFVLFKRHFLISHIIISAFVSFRVFRRNCTIFF